MFVVLELKRGFPAQFCLNHNINIKLTDLWASLRHTEVGITYMCTPPIRPISLNTNGGRNSLRRLVGISLHHLSWKLEFGPLLMMQSTTEEAELTSVSALRPSLFKVSPPKRTGVTHESCHLLGQTRTTRQNARLCGCFHCCYSPQSGA